MNWIRRGVRAVVTFDDDSRVCHRLGDQVAELKSRVSVLTAVLRLVLTLLCGFKLQLLRMVSADIKPQLRERFGSRSTRGAQARGCDHRKSARQCRSRR